MPANRWTLGVPYSFLLNGAEFFSQPGGPNTAVFPQEQNGPWADYPIGGMTINETTQWVGTGCGHFTKEYRIVQEFDYVLGQPCQLLTCTICSYVQRVVYGASQYGPGELYDPILYAVIVA